MSRFSLMKRVVILVGFAGWACAELQPELLDLIDAGKLAEAKEQMDQAQLTAGELVLVRAHVELFQGNATAALHQLAQIYLSHNRDDELMSAALYFEAAIHFKLETAASGCSALDELNTLYPTSPWCRRAKIEFKRTQSEEEGVSE